MEFNFEKAKHITHVYPKQIIPKLLDDISSGRKLDLENIYNIDLYEYNNEKYISFDMDNRNQSYNIGNICEPLKNLQKKIITEPLAALSKILQNNKNYEYYLKNADTCEIYFKYLQIHHKSENIIIDLIFVKKISDELFEKLIQYAFE